jgi:hypothetical protein
MAEVDRPMKYESILRSSEVAYENLLINSAVRLRVNRHALRSTGSWKLKEHWDAQGGRIPPLCFSAITFERPKIF